MNTTVRLQQDTIERRPMSYADYLDFASDSQKMEWVDGEILIYMSASTVHQRLLVFLMWLLKGYVDSFRLGDILTDPFACVLYEGGPVREPDIAYISNENLENVDDKRMYGAPNLVVEIISPGSVREDNVKKFDDYEQAGVQEYWLVDPRPFQQTVELFRLNNDGVYESVAPDENGRFSSTVLSGFWITNDWLWQSSLPDPQLKLAEIMLTVPMLSDKLKTMYQVVFDTLSSD